MCFLVNASEFVFVPVTIPTLLPSPTDEIREAFIQFGSLTVDWPHKAQSKAYFPPKGTVLSLSAPHAYIS